MGSHLRRLLKAWLRRRGYTVHRAPPFVSSSANPAAWQRAFSANSALIENRGLDRVHYGCADLLLDEPWLNIDIRPRSRQDPVNYVQIDLVQRHPLPSSRFRFAYAQDFIEHLDQDEGLVFLVEAFRCLQPGGVLRLSSPGLRGVLKAHFRANTYEGVTQGRGEAYLPFGHRHFWCEETISLVARHLGFRDVRVCGWGESDYPELRGLETRIRQAHINLHVELVK